MPTKRIPLAVALAIALTLSTGAIAQTPPAEAPAPATEPAKDNPFAMPVFGLIGDIAYEPGVGVRYKSPRTSITVYGLIEPTIGNVSNADAGGGHLTGYQVSWLSGNRWGLSGFQALNDSGTLKAIFRLESEYELPTGNMDTPNVLFNRDCWAGFESFLGKITFGRQNTVARDFSQNYGDSFGTAKVTFEEGGWTNTNNFKQLIYFAGSNTSTRLDNGLVWKRAFGDHVMAGLGYQFGEAVGDLTKNSDISLALAFNYEGLNVSGFFTGSNHAGNNQHAYSVGANYTYSLVRLNAGYFHYEAEQGALGHRSDDAFTVSVKVRKDEFEVDLGYQKISDGNAAYNAANTAMTNQFADTSASTKVGTGAKATTYGGLLYHFNRATHAYVMFDYMALSDGYKASGAVKGSFSGTGVDSQLELVTGTRIHF